MKYKTDDIFLSFTVLMIFQLVMSSFLFLSFFVVVVVFVGGGEENQPTNDFKCFISLRKQKEKKKSFYTVRALFKFSFYAIKLQLKLRITQIICHANKAH